MTDAEYIQALQKAISFWLPMVPDGDTPQAQRTAHDAYLLVGDFGADEPSAEALGWIKFA